MTESQIKQDIRSQLSHFVTRTVGARLVEEMEICAGKVRVDMAVISDCLIGIEIKGPLDDLNRLPSQIDQYSKCFDQVVLVVHEVLANDAIRLIPSWWGVIVGTDTNGANSYSVRRRPGQNQRVDVGSVLGLLWRQELEALFMDFIGLAPPKRTSKRNLRDQLLTIIPSTALKIAGIDLLRKRSEWRSIQVE